MIEIEIDIEISIWKTQESTVNYKVLYKYM